METHLEIAGLGFVVIGRNEGERLKVGLQAIKKLCPCALNTRSSLGTRSSLAIPALLLLCGAFCYACTPSKPTSVVEATPAPKAAPEPSWELEERGVKAGRIAKTDIFGNVMKADAMRRHFCEPDPRIPHHEISPTNLEDGGAGGWLLSGDDLPNTVGEEAYKVVWEGEIYNGLTAYFLRIESSLYWETTYYFFVLPCEEGNGRVAELFSDFAKHMPELGLMTRVNGWLEFRMASGIHLDYCGANEDDDESCDEYPMRFYFNGKRYEIMDTRR